MNTLQQELQVQHISETDASPSGCAVSKKPQQDKFSTRTRRQMDNDGHISLPSDHPVPTELRNSIGNRNDVVKPARNAQRHIFRGPSLFAFKQNARLLYTDSTLARKLDLAFAICALLTYVTSCLCLFYV